MDEATKQALLSAVRSILIAAGAWLAAHRYIDSGAVDEIVGAVMVILSLAWGAWDKYRSEAATKARETVAVNVGILVADSTAGQTPLANSAQAAEVIAAIGPTIPVIPEVKPKEQIS